MNEPNPLRTAIIVGSTRPGRVGAAVGQWVHQIAAQRADMKAELLDIADFDLPLLDEPVPPMAAQYSQPHTLKWADTIAGFDAFVFVTAEYNHSIPAALKNALDYLWAEWNDKAAGLVGYGGGGGPHAVEQLRQILAELKVADVRSPAHFTIEADFPNYPEFTPSAGKADEVNTMLDEVVSWGTALRTIRTSA